MDAVDPESCYHWLFRGEIFNMSHLTVPAIRILEHLDLILFQCVKTSSCL